MNKIIESYFNNIKKNFQRFLNNTCKDLNIKSSEIIFLRVLKNVGQTSQIELSKLIECDKSHIHRITNKLLEKKLIHFPHSGSVGLRNFILETTEKGNEIIEKVNISIENWIRKIKIGIDEKELNVCKKVLAKIESNAERINLENCND